MFSPRGFRVLQTLEKFTKEQSMFFDTSNILNKIKFTSLTDNHTQATFVVDSFMCNGSSAIHGGYIASVMDVVGVYGTLARPDGRIGMTTNLNIMYLNSAKIGDKLSLDVEFITTGRRPILEACLRRTKDGALVAKGIASFVFGNEHFQKHCEVMLNMDFKSGAVLAETEKIKLANS